MPLSASEAERYARHIVLKDIGGAGQQKIAAARVLVVGAGGLGSPVIAYLAAAGVGTLGIADPDTVALSNLQRQVLFGTADIGRKKTVAAERFANAINPHVRTRLHAIALDADTGAALVPQYDLVIEGTDDFATKQAIADACETKKIPLVTGALGPFDGSLTVLMPYRDANPGFSDLYPQAPSRADSPPCEIAGVLNVLPGIIGTMMANEALKLIAGYGEPLVGKVLFYSTRTGETTTMRYGRTAP